MLGYRLIPTSDVIFFARIGTGFYTMFGKVSDSPVESDKIIQISFSEAEILTFNLQNLTSKCFTKRFYQYPVARSRSSCRCHLKSDIYCITVMQVLIFLFQCQLNSDVNCLPSCKCCFFLVSWV